MSVKLSSELVDFGNRFISSAILKMQKIQEDSERRLNGFQKDGTLLQAGVFYGNDYYRALKNKGSKKCCELIEKFRNSGAFYHGVVAKRYFEIMARPEDQATGLDRVAYILKEGVLATEGLDAFERGLTFTGCGELIQFCFYQALREVLKDDKFNKLFSSGPMRVCFKYDQSFHPLDALIRTCTARTFDDFMRGDIVRVENIRGYNVKHKLGGFGACNTISCGAGIKACFAGMGLSNPDIYGVAKALVEGFNQPSLGLEILSDASRKKIIAADPNLGIPLSAEMAEFQFPTDDASIEGLLAHGEIRVSPVVYRYDIEKVHQLALATLEEAQTLFAKWHKEAQERHASLM